MTTPKRATDGTSETAGAPNALDITVLRGGPSSEREVSLISGAAIAAGLKQAGHNVTEADISPGDVSALDGDGIDVVFIALHGEFGESGEVQMLCEKRHLRYTGSGPRASELAMDKAASKQHFRRIGLATPDWVVIDDFHKPHDIERWLDTLGYPVVVKPVNGGSSVDCTICRDKATRDAAVGELLDDYRRAFVEAFVVGRELTVGILGDQALPVLEVVPDGTFYDYRAKYSDEAHTQYIFDHDLPEATVEAVKEAALTAHRVLECRDMSRVDFILDESGTPQVLEINTIPGFTSHSLLPMAAKKAGISFDELVDRIARMAMARKP